MGLGDFVPDSLEDWVEDRVEDVGEAIDVAGDWTADRLDDVGWESGADWVRDKTDSAANALGADVDEMQLGESEDPKKLVHGSPDKLRTTAGHLKDFQTAFDNVGKGLQGLDAAHLKGKSADAFRESVSVEPKKWFTAADACEKAAGALENFAGTVEWAQKQAETAIARYKKGKKASDDARSAHNDKVSAYNTAVDAYNAKPSDKRDKSTLPEKPGEFHDPGTADVQAAQDILKEARRQRNEAQTTSKAAVETARDKAPAKPSYARQLADGVDGLNLDASHFVGGIVKGTAGIVNFARQLNPLDLYNITHPAEYVTNLNNTAAGLVRMSNDPWGTLGTMWDTFQKDPSEGLGRLVPELIGTKGLGSIKKVATTARRVAEVKPPGRGLLDEGGPASRATRDGAKTTTGSDPIDFATGRMFLPQTDVTLPGVLPLEFRRRVESGYRAGRWFGPSWSSTADQHLEIGPEGVVFVCEDGRLLDYPHPAPDLPTFPTAGSARWPLERTFDGDYTVTDPTTGLTYFFTAPRDSADGIAPIEEIRDRNGNRIAFHHAPDGTPTDIVHSAGYHLKLTSEDGRITALHLAGAAPDGSDQQLVRYAYTDGNLTEVFNSSGLPLRFEYDDEKRVIAWTDTNDRRYDYIYDNRHRCIAEGGTAGHVSIRLDYHGVDQRTGHRITTVTTAAGHIAKYLINDACQVVGVIDQLGAYTRTEYDRHGRVLAHTDALGHRTAYAYDDHGRLVSLTRPDGKQSHVSYDALGLPAVVTGVDGATWTHEHDARGNRLADTDPVGATTRYIYDDLGRVTSISDALGETSRVRCDAAGLPVEITDPLGAVTAYRRDAFGRPVAIVDPLGATTRLEWSVEGDLLRRSNPDGTRETWTYDGESNCTDHVDAAGGVTTYEYTHFDLLAAQTGPDGARYAFEHDAELRMTKVINPQGLTWSYEYDPAGRLLSETDFDDRTIRYEHDAAGQLIARTTPLGRTIAFERDVLGRVVAKDADGLTTTYAYDPAGHLVSATGPDTEIVLQWDRAGRVKSELVGGRVLTHRYDALGRRTRRTTPGGATTTYAYDAAGHRTTLTASGRTLASEYDASGCEIARHIGGSLSLSQVWDPSGRLAEQALTSPSAGTVQRRAYTYRADGHLVGVEDQLRGHRSFELDAMGRVTAVHARRWSETYAYDEAGNQTHATWPARHPGAEAAGERAYTGTRITRAGRVRYEHDEAGRVTLRQKDRLSKKPDTWRYAWDAENRLTSVTTPDGTVWRYLYDPLGRRTAKQRLAADGETVVERTDFTWDGAILAEQTTTVPGRTDLVTLTWDHDGLQPVAQSERITDATSQREIDRRFFAIVTDVVGTPTELVDESGEIAWRTRTTLWGSTTWASGSTAYTPLRFPGQYYDPESGLHYNVHRYYDPETARYATPDPLGLAPAPNPATYVHNPHTWADPLGLSPYKRANKAADKVVNNAQNGVRKELKPYEGSPRGYHGHLSPTRELEILSNPDAVYLSQGKSGRMLFHQGEDIVITEGPGSRAGQIVTSYGPSGPRMESGVKAFGGSPEEPGLPITRDQIINGKIPSGGNPIAPAKEIWPNFPSEG
ncbi:putative T7SS-secreted protein [Streptomyces sp. NPDC059590]|uniref:putative T7SS-secreted protein n=2 Tax=unclassified Streptomyces TaxID=2593676 RepID=UPI0036B12ECD